VVVHSGSTWMDPSPVVATMYKGLYLSQSVPPTDDWAEFWCPQKRFGHDFFLPCLLLSYYWLMRVWFATREKQQIANPTVKLLFQHSGCCFEVVGMPQVIVGVQFIHWLCVRHCTEWVLVSPCIRLKRRWFHVCAKNTCSFLQTTIHFVCSA